MSSSAVISRSTRRSAPPSGPDPQPRRRWPARLLALSALGAVLFANASPIDPEIHALAAALGERAEGVVSPDEIRWEPSRGALLDLVRGRNVLFLAHPAGNAARDVYRARVRLSFEGRPLGIVALYNLTNTPLGDDHSLVVRGTRAAFATSAFGQEQSVTSLDLLPIDAAPGSLGERAMRFLTNLQETGESAGIARVDVTLDPPARRVGLALLEPAGDGERAATLKIDAADDRNVKTASIDLDRLEVHASPGDGERLKLEVVDKAPKRFVHWAVDTVRAVPWIGPAPIAWLEERVFALRDSARQAAFELHGSSDHVRADAQSTLAAPVLEGALASRDEDVWPPAKVASIWTTPEPGEGEWVAPKIDWIKRLDVAKAPSAFVRTFVRPDEQRPYARVLLVAMDTRRLDLAMEAGSEDPKPLVGPAGPGRLPRDPAISSRVVAAFNGAFKTEHGFHGMMVDKRVLLPPVPGAATVIVLKDGRTGLGSWGPSKEVTGVLGVPDADIVSLRQNLDPLVSDGVVNPSKRSMWGFTLPGTSMQTERSGLCVTASGHLLYAWGDDVSGLTLAKAMKLAGCIYGMHLDMNPHHTGFLFANIDDLKARKYRTELLTTDMEIPNDRYLEHSAKDFFYLMAREPAPSTPPAVSGGARWAAAKSAQPTPAWFPGLFDAEVLVQNRAVSLFDVESGRANFRIRRGGSEPDVGAGGSSRSSSVLDDGDASRVLFALGMGVSHEKRPRGLVVGGRAIAPVRAAENTAILVSSGGVLSIKTHDDMSALTLGPEVDFSELPLLFVGSETRSHGPAPSGANRSALGITDDGRVVVARGASLPDNVLADALRGAGCTRAVLLDRGAESKGTFERSQSDAPTHASYDETVLYGIARPMKPRAFRFEADTAVAAGSKPTK